MNKQTTPTTELDERTLANMTEAEWQARLSPSAYYVLRQKGTEPPFTGQYTDCIESGIYVCQGCGAPLFASQDKFHSGCGWPSFDRPLSEDALQEHLDTSHGMRRIEVTCGRCGGHLGHVFEDGPRDTTGLRYCINSVAVALQPID